MDGEIHILEINKILALLSDVEQIDTSVKCFSPSRSTTTLNLRCVSLAVVINATTGASTSGVFTETNLCAVAVRLGITFHLKLKSQIFQHVRPLHERHGVFDIKK